MKLLVFFSVTNQMDDCPVPCNLVIVQVGAKEVETLPANHNSSSSSYGETLFYFPSRVVVSKEKYFYSVLPLLAEIGGYVGLLLGSRSLTSLRGSVSSWRSRSKSWRAYRQ
jgi:hypothetical protein